MGPEKKCAELYRDPHVGKEDDLRVLCLGAWGGGG